MVASTKKKGSHSAEFFASRSVASTKSWPPKSGPYATSVHFQNVNSGDVFVFAQSALPYGSVSIMRVRAVRKCVRKSFMVHAAAQKSSAAATVASKGSGPSLAFPNHDILLEEERLHRSGHLG